MELASLTMSQQQSQPLKRYIILAYKYQIGVLMYSNNFSFVVCVQVVKATQGRIPVFLDGGVRRGTDVFKALALGASGIFVSIASLIYQKAA